MKPFVYDIGLKVAFRGLTRRSGILFEGPAGWAEWSPFQEYDDTESATWLRAALETAEVGFPAPLRDRIEINAIVPALEPQAAAERALAAGCGTVKIKVAAPGQSLAEDVARVAAVRAALPMARLRVDANGAWTLHEARSALAALGDFDLEYAEQPCATVEELAKLRACGLGVAIAADESIRRAADPHRVKELAAADVVVLKVQPLGGVTNCLRLAAELDLPVVVSSAVETSIGLAAGLALAAALPGLDRACGLETGRLLTGDVVEQPLLPEGGWLSTTEGLSAAPELLARHRADPDLSAWWLARWERVHALLEARG